MWTWGHVMPTHWFAVLEWKCPCMKQPESSGYNHGPNFEKLFLITVTILHFWSKKCLGNFLSWDWNCRMLLVCLLNAFQTIATLKKTGNRNHIELFFYENYYSFSIQTHVWLLRLYLFKATKINVMFTKQGLHTLATEIKPFIVTVSNKQVHDNFIDKTTFNYLAHHGYTVLSTWQDIVWQLLPMKKTVEVTVKKSAAGLIVQTR